MKHLKKLFGAALLFAGMTSQAQDSNNPWAISFGANGVDTKVSAVGNDSPKWINLGNTRENWNILPSVSYLNVSRYVGDGFSFGLTGSVNKVSKWVVRDLIVNPGDLTYYAIDATIKYSFMEMLKSKWLDPSINLGGGYNFVGDASAGTVNGGLGLTAPNKDNYSCGFHIGIKQFSFGTNNIKKYTILLQLEEDGITSISYPFVHNQATSFFRLSPNANFFLNFIEPLATGEEHDYQEIIDAQKFTDGELRRAYIFYDSSVFTLNEIGKINTICEYLESKKMPLHIFYGGDYSLYSNVTELTTACDLASVEYPNVSVVIGQDGANLGYSLSTNNPAVGAAMGLSASKKVSEDIGYVRTSNIADDEFE
jgi:hypothetical protein